MNDLLLKRQYRLEVLRRSLELPSTSKVHLGISMPNPKHSGVKLAVMIDWAVRKYDVVQIDLYDAIQRHNIAAITGVSDIEAYQMALKAGDIWINENHHILATYPNVTLKRYDELKALFPQADNRLTELDRLYHSDSVFSEIINREIQSFLDRRQTREGGWSSEKFESLFQHSKSYILDELSVMSLLAETEGYLEVYAGTFLNILTDPERLKVENLPIGLKHYPILEVDFKRVKAAHPERRFG